MEPVSGGKPGNCPLPTALLVVSVPGTLKLRRKRAEIQGVAMLCLEHTRVSFVTRLFIFLWPAVLGEASGKGLNGIFISFSGMSFNMLIHQNARVEGSGVIFCLVLSSKKSSRTSLERGGYPGRPSVPGWSGMCKPFAPKRPWLGKIKAYDSLAGCKSFKLCGLVSLFCLFPIPLVKEFLLQHYSPTHMHILLPPHPLCSQFALL